jgi:virginiamycin A acetyltransferase
MPWPDEALTSAWLDSWLAKSGRDYLNVDCGAWTYGRPRVHSAPSDVPRKLTIGRYCSIADGVELFVGREGRHSLDTLSTYPIGMAVSKSMRARDAPRAAHPELFVPSKADISANLDVKIGHDVWLGTQAIIFAGITIGTGAVVGARTVVTKDVPPYAIVAGAPARISRFRHDPEVIEKLLLSHWWNFDPDEIWERCGSLLKSTRVLDVISLLHASAGI